MKSIREIQLARDWARFHVTAHKIHAQALVFERNRGHFLEAANHAAESEWHRLAAKAHVKSLVREGLSP